ncbi:MAG: hypothetical protein ACM3ON_07075 [Chloroflexota bacterium]
MRMVRSMVLVTTAVALIAAVALAADVEKGKALFSDPKLGTVGKACADCHKDGKGLHGVAEKREFFKEKKKITLEEAVNFCVVNGIKGKALKGDDLANMIAYIKTFKALPPAPAKKKKIEGC